MEVRLVVGRVLRHQILHSAPYVARTMRTQPVAWTKPSLLAQRPFSSSIARWQDGESDADKHLNSALDLKTDTPGSSRHSKSHFASLHAQRQRQSERSGQAPSRLNLPERGRASMDDLLSDFTEFGMNKARQERRGDRMEMGSLLDPMGVSDKLDPMRNTSIAPQQSQPLPLPVRLGPTLGRTVKVNPGRNIDVGRAFRQLEILCRKNAVRADFQRQRFHERGGLKRKRVRSERWRRTFMEGFKGMIALVKKMKKQGW